MKRAVTRKEGLTRAPKKSDLRSLVFTDSVLEYLVHLHLLPGGNKPGHRLLSFNYFVAALSERYGFCVDVAPLGMTISNELLQANRARLERRLRDLGLLVGVNDAEAMKRLRPRFRCAGRFMVNGPARYPLSRGVCQPPACLRPGGDRQAPVWPPDEPWRTWRHMEENTLPPNELRIAPCPGPSHPPCPPCSPW